MDEAMVGIVILCRRCGHGRAEHTAEDIFGEMRRCSVTNCPCEWYAPEE